MPSVAHMYWDTAVFKLVMDAGVNVLSIVRSGFALASKIIRPQLVRPINYVIGTSATKSHMLLSVLPSICTHPCFVWHQYPSTIEHVFPFCFIHLIESCRIHYKVLLIPSILRTQINDCVVGIVSGPGIMAICIGLDPV